MATDCSQCRFEAPYHQGEWQCRSCSRWWWSRGSDRHRLYDRDQTEDQITAKEQVAILHATRTLERQGLRSLVHFGWQTAVSLAAITDAGTNGTILDSRGR